MGYVVRMPQLGMTMETGMVVDWTVDPDEPVEAGEVIAVVESEKTTNEVEAREDGVVVEHFVELEEAVPPGHPIAYFGEAGGSVPEEVRAELDEAASAEPDDDGQAGAVATTPAPETSAGDRRVSPRARSFAAENDVALEPLLDGIEGTGPGGAVVEADVITAVEAGAAGAEAPVGRDIYEERTPSQLRKTIAERMAASVREAPQVTLNRRVPVDRLLEFKDRLEADLDGGLSLADFLIAASVDALEAHPAFNAVYEDGVHRLAGTVNVGLAVDLEGGLVTPILRGADDLSLIEIGTERSALVSRVQAGDYTNDDFAGGTFTISNLGTLGVESFDPILNPPEVALLGVGTITAEVDPETGDPVRRLGLSLTFDHRAVDGADAARFLDAIADGLTHPERLTGRDVDLGGDGPDTGRVAFERAADAPDEPRTATATHEAGMRASVGAAGFRWGVDEPERYGGDDTAPSPVDQFLGSLASCLTLTIATVADRRDVALSDLAVTVDAAPEEGHIERLDTTVSAVSAADADDVERVVETAERACYVNHLVREDLDRSLSIEVTAPG